ncbi:ribosome biogenesis factor YjgA [Pigmentiphaga aceris]|nr:ribosome biogenesis factor YjgA [Pigmentiphaga aceris]
MPRSKRSSQYVVNGETPEKIDYSGMPPSKSQVKREATELQELGERLIKLSRGKLVQLPLPELLFEAILEAQRITAHEGKRRQLQYVGKLMRHVHAEPIRAKMAEWDGETQTSVDAYHRLERWRDRLIDSDEHFTAFMNANPAGDAQQLRALIRSARKEQAFNRDLPQGNEPQRKAYRSLFQEIKRLVEGDDYEEPGSARDNDDQD